MSDRGIFACSSISRTSGRISRPANAYTLSRTSGSSPERIVSGEGTAPRSTGRSGDESAIEQIVTQRGRFHHAVVRSVRVYPDPRGGGPEGGNNAEGHTVVPG